MRFVTSMSTEGYREYGKKFLDSFKEFCDKRLRIYSEDPLENEGLPVVDLNLDAEFRQFLSECPPESKHYQWQVGKFAKKVFAITDPFIEDDWLIWIDADVVLDKPLDERFFEKTCPENQDGAYLGRKDWHTSECGFVSYNLKRRGGTFLKRLREVYTSGEIFDHLEWHDSYLFDRVMEEGYDFLNLSEGVSGMHVWDDTILGEYSRHLKGPLRKAGRKGDVPKKYWSERECDTIS